jgi:alkylhydroperoxidase family enzyme
MRLLLPRAGYPRRRAWAGTQPRQLALPARVRARTSAAPRGPRRKRRPGSRIVGLASALLCRHGLADELDAAEVVSAGSRLWDWVDRALAPTLHPFHLATTCTTEEGGGLSKAEREMIVVATSGANHCQYCMI